MEQGGFSNRADWFHPFSALVVWSAHFVLLWGTSVALPDDPAARWIAVAVTALAAVALGWLWWRADRPALTTMPGLGIAIAAAGVGYGVLPAIIG